MTIAVGQRLPGATLLRMGDAGPEGVALGERLKGRKVVMFAVPGAFTGTCTTAHMPSFVRTAKALAAKGVDEIICLSVNDPFVTNAWADVTGANTAGISVLADADAGFSKAIGMTFSVESLGLIDRSKRYALYAVDGVVKVFHPEPAAGCEISTGEAMLAAI